MPICGRLSPPAREACRLLASAISSSSCRSASLILQGVIQVAFRILLFDGFDEGPRARHRAQDVPHQAEIGRVMRIGSVTDTSVAPRDRSAWRRIGGFGRQDVFLAQDRDPVAVDQQARALIGVGHHACADDDSLVRLELTFKAMPVLRRRFLKAQSLQRECCRQLRAGASPGDSNAILSHYS